MKKEMTMLLIPNECYIHKIDVNVKKSFISLELNSIKLNNKMYVLTYTYYVYI